MAIQERVCHLFMLCCIPETHESTRRSQTEGEAGKHSEEGDGTLHEGMQQDHVAAQLHHAMLQDSHRGLKGICTCVLISKRKDGQSRAVEEGCRRPGKQKNNYVDGASQVVCSVPLLSLRV